MIEQFSISVEMMFRTLYIVMLILAFSRNNRRGRTNASSATSLPASQPVIRIPPPTRVLLRRDFLKAGTAALGLASFLGFSANISAGASQPAASSSGTTTGKSYDLFTAHSSPRDFRDIRPLLDDLVARSYKNPNRHNLPELVLIPDQIISVNYVFNRLPRAARLLSVEEVLEKYDDEARSIYNERVRSLEEMFRNLDDHTPFRRRQTIESWYKEIKRDSFGKTREFWVAKTGVRYRYPLQVTYEVWRDYYVQQKVLLGQSNTLMRTGKPMPCFWLSKKAPSS